MTFRIEKNIPLPKTHKRAKYPFAEMSVSDSFFAPAKDGNRSPSVAAHSYGLRNSKKFSVRKVTEDGVGGYRVWRIE